MNIKTEIWKKKQEQITKEIEEYDSIVQISKFSELSNIIFSNAYRDDKIMKKKQSNGKPKLGYHLFQMGLGQRGGNHRRGAHSGLLRHW